MLLQITIGAFRAEKSVQRPSISLHYAFGPLPFAMEKNMLENLCRRGLMWLAMRMLPKMMSPARDPVTMWTREEVLERYQIRKDKEWKKKAVNEKRERYCDVMHYPWTPAYEMSSSS
ncbi:hypothetical protein Aduo_008110 [Ancylostoma duodenale]